MLCSLGIPVAQRRWALASHGACRPAIATGAAWRRAGQRRPAAPLVKCKGGSSPEPGHLTPPLQVTTLKTLTGEERMPAPIWDTFCGVSNGLWIGTAAAYNPYTGEAEPVSKEGRTLVLQQGTCVVEQRVLCEDGRDLILRRKAYSNNEEAFHEALREASRGECSGGEGSGVEWGEEEVERDQPGLAIFDGGTYTTGPVALGCAAPSASELEAMQWEDGGEEWVEEGEAEESDGEGDEEVEGESWDEPPPEQDAAVPGRVASVSEWCLQWGSGHRVRLQLTLSTAGGVDGSELDVEVLRVALAREQWEGLPGTYAPSAKQQAGMHINRPGPRLDPKKLSGQWKVFEATRVTVEDVSMATGLPCLVAAYTTRELQQQLETPGGVDDSMEEDGATLWLPHKVALQLRMVLPGSETAAAGGSKPPGQQAWEARQDAVIQRGSNGNGAARRPSTSGNGSGPPSPAQVLPGLAVGVSWVPEDNALVTLTRVYAGDGTLQSVTYSTAIRAV